MSFFQQYNPSRCAQPSSHDAAGRHLAGIPTTASDALKMVKTGVLKYRVGQSNRNRSIFPDPLPTDFHRTSSEFSDSSSSASPSTTDSQRTHVGDGSVKLMAPPIQKVASEPVSQAASGVSSRRRGRSIIVQSPTRTIAALRCQSPPSGPLPPVASPKSAKRAQYGAVDIAGSLFGKHPSTAGSPFYGNEVTIDYRMRLGEGSQSDTYVGRLHGLVKSKGHLVFLKSVNKRWCSKHQMYAEGRANERLISAASDEVHHPNEAFVAKIHAFVDLPAPVDKYVFVYELHHYDLTKVLKHPFSSSYAFDAPQNCPRWVAQIASAIDYVHNNGIIHRDIKPANVLVDSQLNMRLTDLGVSFVSKERQALKPHGLYAFLLCGTDLYMAPEIEALKDVAHEQHKEWKAADPEEKEGVHAFYGPAVDWYAFGVLAYEMAATFYRSRGRGSTYKFDIVEKEALIKVWNGAIDAETMTVSKVGMASWNEFMKTRNVPKQLWSLLWKLLDPSATHRATFNDVSKNSFFRQGGESLFNDLAKTSFDEEKRPHRATPSELWTINHLVRDTIKVTNTHPDFLRKGRRSWIDPKSYLFKYLKEADSEDEEECDDETDEDY